MENILAIITHWDDADAVLSKAEYLAKQFHTQLEVLLPVHTLFGELGRYLNPADFDRLKGEALNAQTQTLKQLCADKNYPLHVVWADRIHTTIIEKATAYGAGLIVMMASHDPRLASLVHTPDDWHLFRETPCPVLSMTRNRQAAKHVIAAIDSLDTDEAHQQLSARVLDCAAALAKAEDLPLKVISVVPDPALLYAGVVNAPMSANFLIDTVDKAKEKAVDTVKRLGIQANSVDAVSGRVEHFVTSHSQDQAGLLVIGNSANKGVKGLLLGNTAERILHHMKSDMLVVN